MSPRIRITIALSLSFIFCLSFLFAPGHSLWIIKSFGIVTLGVNALFLLWEFIFWKIPFWSKYTSSPPFINGTWKGTLYSNYKNPKDNSTKVPIEVFLVINQTSDLVTKVAFYSEESSSSAITSPALTKNGEQWEFSYVYQNHSKYDLRNSSPIHNGTVLLTLDNEKNKTMQGSYWTDRCTRGEIKFTQYSKATATNFSKAKELFPKE